MLKIFRKKTKLEKLQLQYEKLMSEAHKISTVNRKLSDDKVKAAHDVLVEIEELNKKAKGY